MSHLFGLTPVGAVRYKKHPSLFEQCTSCLLHSYTPHQTLTAREKNIHLTAALFNELTLNLHERFDVWPHRCQQHPLSIISAVTLLFLNWTRELLKSNDAYCFVDSEANGYSHKWISGQKESTHILYTVPHATKVSVLRCKNLEIKGYMLLYRVSRMFEKTCISEWIHYPCTKLVVPSTGSIIHVGLSVKTQGSPAATDSSPMKLKQIKTCHNSFK